MPRILIISAAVMLATGIAARAEEHIPCWVAKAFLAYHGGDRQAAERDAIVRGYSWRQIQEATRRCLNK